MIANRHSICVRTKAQAGHLSSRSGTANFRFTGATVLSLVDVDCRRTCGRCIDPEIRGSRARSQQQAKRRLVLDGKYPSVLDSSPRLARRAFENFAQHAAESFGAECDSATLGFIARARSAVFRRVWLEQLNEIAGRIFQKNLLAADALDHLVAEVTAGLF